MNFTKTLLSWYNRNHRKLPWRETRDPYRIWISEVVLQQTRIEQGLEYYLRFTRRFPDVQHLAEASEKEVLRLWQGLGYYSRARNLHVAAREIMKNHGGEFPSEYKEIRALKGVGDYTAAAIASISFGLQYPVVDGNVLRFFSRCFGVEEPVDKAAGKKRILDIARKMMDAEDPGQYNQAIMEFGALQCKPGLPDCSACPFRKSCFAFIHGKVPELPLKSATAVTRNRYFHYLVITHEEPGKGTSVILKKRGGNDIWKNLYDFPLIESQRPLSLDKLRSMKEWKSITGSEQVEIQGRSKMYKHILSHQVIWARFYEIQMNGRVMRGFLKVPLKKIDTFPVPRLIEKYLKSGYTENHREGTEKH
jgi:A/G-specific adenine glycosylase